MGGKAKMFMQSYEAAVKSALHVGRIQIETNFQGLKIFLELRQLRHEGKWWGESLILIINLQHSLNIQANS